MPNSKTKIHVMFDLDDTLVDFTGAKERALLKYPENPFPQSQYGFFDHLEPKPFAVDVIKELLDDPWIVPEICTAPSVLNPMSYTGKRWCVEKHFGLTMCHRLYIAPDKSRVVADMLVDDKASGFGQEGFGGILLQVGTKKYPDLNVILSEIRRLSASNSKR